MMTTDFTCVHPYQYYFSKQQDNHEEAAYDHDRPPSKAEQKESKEAQEIED